MKKIVFITVIVILFCVSCRSQNNDALNRHVSDYAKQLFLNKNAYVGDASANGKLLTLLAIEKELGNYSVELKTDQKPYWIQLNFEEYVSDRNAFDIKMLDTAFLILALINNVDEVRCAYPYRENGQDTLITLYITEKQATDALGKDIKSFAKSEERVEELLTQLSN